VATYNVSLTEAASAADSLLARMVSDAQFADWLKADNRRRCVLVEAVAYSGGSEVTRYLSNLGYTSAPGESPANTAYEDILTGIPEIRSYMGEAFRGRSLITYGDVEIDNSGGARDAWLNDAWHLREIRIYLGDPSWQRSDFRLVFKGVTDDIRARDGNTLALRIKDRQALLDVPLQTATISAGTLTGRKKPVCYGTCYRVPAPSVDSSSQVYQCSDKPLLAIDAVYEDGFTITGSCLLDPTGAVYGWGAGGAFAYSGHAIGYTAGFATADVRNVESYTGDIVKRILIERAGLTEAQIDPAAVTAWNAAAGGNRSIGYWTMEDGVTVAEALDTIMAGIGGYYTVDRDGRITGGVFDRPSLANSVLTLTADDIEDGEVELLKRIVPPLSERLGYTPYWGLVSSVNTGAGLTAQQIARLRTRYDVHTTAYTLGFEHQGSIGDLSPTLFASSAGAISEASRRRDLWSDLRFVFRVRAFLGAQQVKIGDCVTLTVPRYGFDAGEKTIVVGMRETITGGYVELELFR
jgi:hypothetical protein